MSAVYPLPGFFEPVSSMMHLAAAGVFAVLGVRLIRDCRGDRLRTGLVSVFVLATVIMFSMSGVYHMLAGDGIGAAVMFRLDKAAIFVLIAATFTPVHGLLFHGAIRWTGLALMWAAAATGVTLTTVFFDRMPNGLSTVLYIALGWMAGLSVIALWKRHRFRAVRTISAGGLAYTIGAILLAMKWPTIVPRVFGPHELWHIAVIIGLALHWRFVARFAESARRVGRAKRNLPPPASVA